MIQMKVTTVLASVSLIVLALYAGQKVPKLLGSREAKLAATTSERCDFLKRKPNGAQSDVYLSCMKDLEVLVGVLASTGELQLQTCRVKKDKATTTCQIWVWFQRKELVITDEKLVQYITDRNKQKPQPVDVLAPLRRMFSKH